MADEEEIWKRIPGFLEYEASNLGRVRSLKFGKVRIMKLRTHPHIGYVDVRLDRKLRNVHRLVLLAFVGPCPEGHEAAHIDGNRANNKLKNLAWKTASENQLDRRKHGTSPLGGRTPKLSPDAVREIRTRPESNYELAKIYGVVMQTISHVRTRRTWKNI